MKQSPKKYAESLLALEALLSRTEAEGVIKHLVGYFARRGNMKFLRMVAFELAACIKKQQKRIDVTVISAHKISKDTAQELTHALESRFSGTVILLDTRVNPNLIAGSIITIEDYMFDSSLLSRFHTFKAMLASSS